MPAPALMQTRIDADVKARASAVLEAMELTVLQNGCRPRNWLKHRLAAGFLKEFAGSRQSVEFDKRKAADLGALANSIQ